jgi:hypothetical protein
MPNTSKNPSFGEVRAVVFLFFELKGEGTDPAGILHLVVVVVVSE